MIHNEELLEVVNSIIFVWTLRCCPTCYVMELDDRLI